METGKSNRGKSPLLARVLIAGVIALVVIPAALPACRNEVRRWQTAAALNAMESGNRSEALNRVEGLASLIDLPVDLRLHLARTYVNLGRPESALSLLEPVNPGSFERHLSKAFGLEFYRLRFQAHCELSRTEDAAEDLSAYDGLIGEGARNSASYLNEMAYLRSKAGVELAVALLEIERVMDRNVNVSFRPAGLKVPVPVATLAALGLLVGSGAEASKVVELIDQEIDLLRLNREADLRQVFATLVTQLTAAKSQLQDNADALARFRSLAEASGQDLALLLTVRAWMLEQEGNSPRSQEMRAEVARMGFDSDRILADLPNRSTCGYYVENYSHMIDTYGWVLRALGKESEALDRVELAVLAIDSGLKTREVDLELPRNVARKGGIQPWLLARATILEHRRQLLQESGAVERAGQDAAAIRRMGYEPGSAELF